MQHINNKTNSIFYCYILSTTKTGKSGNNIFFKAHDFISSERIFFFFNHSFIGAKAFIGS